MSEGIAYQNKDILLKFFGELYEDVTHEYFGLKNIPKIEKLLPSNFQSNSRRKSLRYDFPIG
ncbi:hypothetical protein [Virgibacillus kimchii]